MSTFSTCTSSTRPGSPANGDVLFETDTKNVILWDGTNWRGYNNDGALGWTGSNISSILFDGTDDYLSLSSVVTPSATSGSISAWFKTGTNAFMPLFSVSSNTSGDTNYWFVIQIDSGGKIEVGFRNGGTVPVYESSTTVTNNAWHHVMVTSNGTAWKLFLDGAEDTSATGTNTGDWIGDLSIKNSCNIGGQRRDADGSNTYFAGNIDEVAIWDSDESSNISTIYNGGTPGNILSLSPEHWYRMGDNNGASGTLLVDQGSVGVNATLTNTPAYSTSVPS